MKPTQLAFVLIAVSMGARTLRATTEAPEIIWKAQANSEWAGALAFSPEGKYLVSGGRDNQVHIWDVSNGTLVRTLEGHSGEILAVGISPDGKSVASASSEDRSVRLWNLSDGMLIRQITHADWPTRVTFSPDGTLIGISVTTFDPASRISGRTDIYRVADGRFLRALSSGLSQDGQWRLSARCLGSSGGCNPQSYEMSLWRNAGESYWMSTNENYRFSIPWGSGTFSPNNEFLLATTPGAQENPLGSILTLYRVGDGAQLRTLTFPKRGDLNNPITWIDGRAFSPDNQLIGAISASTRVFDPGPYVYIAFWNVSTGELIKYYRDDLGAPAYGDTPLLFSPDGQFFAYSRGEGTIVLARSPSNLPRLDVSRAGDQVVMSWTTPLSAWTLESSESLGASAMWTAVEAAPVQIAGKQIVTLNLDSKATFFRLHRP
jgi:WD40 repeat protein